MPATQGPIRSSLTWTIDPRRAFAPGPRWWVRETPNGAIVHFHDEAEFRICPDPRGQIVVTLGPASEEEAALSFLLAALPLALPLFALEPFHGAGLEMEDGRALLVLGPPEAGKSTTAAALRARELRFLADDACAIDETGHLWPGAPLLATRGRNADEVPIAEYDGKSVFEIGEHDATPREVGGSVVLRPDRGAELAIEDLRGRDAIVALLGQVRSPRVLPSRRKRLQLEGAARLAGERVGVVSFDKGIHTPDEVAEAILGWIAA
jgi:hypothetical protein